ncbi:hypothetical protein GJ744_000599 [Endocarpon pusillum]|uniref:Uncharacterized protein n=1 Tax=Endocarpon pusillum TaxID=364733 RepID=A0A8H7A7F6_9EURO|nr:hypothetical protein GJ744_000599 [Endocarpon pusillum]
MYVQHRRKARAPITQRAVPLSADPLRALTPSADLALAAVIPLRPPLRPLPTARKSSLVSGMKNLGTSPPIAPTQSSYFASFGSIRRSPLRDL